MLGRLWRKVVWVLTAAAAVLTFLLAMELIRAYQTLRDVHPWAGYAFLAVLAGGLVWMVGRLLGGWRFRPRPLKCPDVGDLGEADPHTLRRYGRYLGKYLRRLSINESLTDEHRAQAASASEALACSLPRCRSGDELSTVLREAESEQIEPLLAHLDAQAEREISTCVRDVIVGVVASPWPLLDALIVLYRNGGMITRVTHVYNSRPAIREQLSVFLDTIRLVATIKLAHMMRKILERTVQDVPLAGRVVEMLTQAVGAGVLTSVAGHAAKHRCRAFRGWDRDEAARTLRAQLGDFLADCGRVAREVIGSPLGRLYEVSTDVLGKVGTAFKKAIDATCDAADTFVRKPVVAGGRHVANGVRSSTRWLFGRRRG